MKFSPEAGKPRADDVALIDRLLKSIVPDAEFDGAQVTWQDGKDKRTSTPAEYSLSPDTLAACRRIAGATGSEDLLATIVLRPLQRMLAPAEGDNPAIMTKMGNFLNRISSDRKMLAAELFQRELAKISYERRVAGNAKRARPQAPESVRGDVSSERASIDFLRAAYRPQWLANGGPIDPNTFESVPDSIKRWAANEIESIRATFQDDKDGEHVGRGEALEMFAGVELARHRWLGAEISVASTLDDYRNGVDLVGEFVDPETGEVARCALDLGSTRTMEGAGKKLRKGNSGAEVQFFRSKVETKDGKGVEMRLEGVPMVILGVTGAVLAEVGAAVRRGEKVGPDHPIGAVFLRQAEIQVGLQIRKIAADFMANALDNMPSEPETLRAVETYAEGYRRSGDGFLRNVHAVRDLMRAVPADGAAYYLGRREAERLRNLLVIHKVLAQKIALIDETRPDVRRISDMATISRTLKEYGRPQPSQSKISPIGEIFLRVARLCLLRDRFRGLSLEAVHQSLFGIVGLPRKQIDRRDDLVGRPFRWGYLVVRLLGHRV